MQVQYLKALLPGTHIYINQTQLAIKITVTHGIYYLHKGDVHKSTDISTTDTHVLDYKAPVLKAQVPALQMTRYLL